MKKARTKFTETLDVSAFSYIISNPLYRQSNQNGPEFITSIDLFSNSKTESEPNDISYIS